MANPLHQSMSWLHTWTGLLLGWLLYFMFITGTLGYFEDEIDRWMKPEIKKSHQIDQMAMFELGKKRLQTLAVDAQSWEIYLPASRRPFLTIWWQDFPEGDSDKRGKWHHKILNADTGDAIEYRDTAGGRTLYRMHYALHYMPKILAYVITSVAALFMLIALITGIVIHKRIFKDFFTFRPSKRQRSWLDIHNVMSVFPLPFHLMITYSGLIFLMSTTMPGIVATTYGVDKEAQKRFVNEVFAKDKHPEATGIQATNVDMLSVISKAKEQWGDVELAYISIENRGDTHAHIEVAKSGYEGINKPKPLIFNGVTGEQIGIAGSKAEQNDKPYAYVVYKFFTVLHEGLFADYVLRWLYFLSGLLGAGMVATGAILWAAKRRDIAEKRKITNRGLLLVEGLNAGAIVGIPISVGVYFLANRLLPVDLSERASIEVDAMFIALAITLIYPFFRPIIKAWVELLLIAALVFLLLPIVNGVTTEHNIVESIVNGDWIMAGVDMTFLLTGLVCLLACMRIKNKGLFGKKSTKKDRVLPSARGEIL